jgi:hypothetical protein
VTYLTDSRNSQKAPNNEHTKKHTYHIRAASSKTKEKFQREDMLQKNNKKNTADLL